VTWKLLFRTQQPCLAAWLLSTAGCLPAAESTPLTPMTIQQHTAGESRELTVNAQPIRAAERPALPPRATPGPQDDYLTPFGNPSQNSRVGRPVADGKWEVLWKTPLRPRNTPSFVLQAGDRLAVQATVWQLFDLEGRLIASNLSGAGQLNLDAPRGLFYFIDKDGYVAARDLPTGKEKFTTMATMGDEGKYPLLYRHGRKFIMAGIERQLDPHGHHKASTSEVGVIDLGEPMQVADSGLVLSVKTVGNLKFSDRSLLAALSGERLVVALPKEFLIGDLDGNVKGRWSDKFEPKALSLDELVRSYLVVDFNGTQFLWIMNAEGQRVLAVALPKDQPVVHPPIIGYDHKVYLVSAKSIQAFDPAGNPVFSIPIKNGFGGAAVTADDKLLVADGPELVVFGSDGLSKVLHSFGKESLKTPAILTPQGRILVATDETLFCLQPVPANKR